MCGKKDPEGGGLFGPGDKRKTQRHYEGLERELGREQRREPGDGKLWIVDGVMQAARHPIKMTRWMMRPSQHSVDCAWRRFWTGVADIPKVGSIS